MVPKARGATFLRVVTTRKELAGAYSTGDGRFTVLGSGCMGTLDRKSGGISLRAKRKSKEWGIYVNFTDSRHRDQQLLSDAGIPDLSQGRNVILQECFPFSSRREALQALSVIAYREGR